MDIMESVFVPAYPVPVPVSVRPMERQGQAARSEGGRT